MQKAKLTFIFFVIFIILWLIAFFVVLFYPLFAFDWNFLHFNATFGKSLLFIIVGVSLLLGILWVAVKIISRPFNDKIYEKAIQSKNYDEAIEYCEKRIDYSFKKDAEAWNQLINVYYLQGDFEKVVYTLKCMMEIRMKNNQAFETLLDFYLYEADYNNAVEMCSHYLETYPNTYKIQTALEKIYKKFSNVDEITRHFKKLINLANRYLSRFPTKHEIFYLIAKIYEEQGELEKSLEKINNALQIRATSLVYQKYKEDLLLRLENIEKDLKKNSLTSD